jgi:hypothetical protein
VSTREFPNYAIGDGQHGSTAKRTLFKLTLTAFARMRTVDRLTVFGTGAPEQTNLKKLKNKSTATEQG